MNWPRLSAWLFDKPQNLSTAAKALIGGLSEPGEAARLFSLRICTKPKPPG
jgi:hypothetical protein